MSSVSNPAKNPSASERLRELHDRMSNTGWYWWMSEGPPWEIGQKDGPVHLGVTVTTGTADAEGIATLRNALPLIADIVEAAEMVENGTSGWLVAMKSLPAKAAALREHLERA